MKYLGGASLVERADCILGAGEGQTLAHRTRPYAMAKTFTQTTKKHKMFTAVIHNR